MISALVKIARGFQRGNNPLFSADIGFQQEFIKSLGDPVDDFERGYFQYRCQMKLLGGRLRFLYNLTSIPLMLLYKMRIARAYAPTVERAYDAVFIFDGDDTILPPSLKENHNIIQAKDCHSQLLLTKEDAVFLTALRKRYPLAWHFRFKCMMKVAMYRYQLAVYMPELFVVSSEYSFTSSVLTAYCEKVGVKHVNVMHGEKLYCMRDAFFHFHECYVWEEHYRKLFTEMQAETKQFIIGVPPCIAPWEGFSSLKTMDYTYYLGAEKRLEMEQIKHSLDLLIKAGKKVAVRPHPLYSSFEDMKSVFYRDSNYVIEDKSTLTIETSVLRTRYVVSSYSTVLFQAINNGLNIVVDDITDEGKYRKLKSLRYICLEKEHLLLSDVLKNIAFE